MSKISTISSQMPTEMPAAVPRSRTRLLIRYPIATKTAPSMIEVPSMEAKAYQLAASTERAGDGKRGRRGAIADDGGEGEDQHMPAEFSENDLVAADRIAEQQDHGATLHLADDRIMRNQKRDQRQQKDREAGQADDDDVERAGADIAGRRAAEECQGQRKRRQQQRGRQDPAVAQPFLDFLAGDDDDVPHAAFSRRKWA